MKNSHRGFWRARIVVFAALLPGCITAAAEDLSATPYRPSVASTADLSAPGYLELEMGWQIVSGGADPRRSGFPYLTKYAFSDRFGMMLGGEAAVSLAQDGGTLKGAGDNSLTVKFKQPLADEKSALGVEIGVNLPTGKIGLSSGKPNYRINGIYSTELGEFHADLNANYSRLGAPGGDSSKDVYGWALAVSHALGADPRWTATLEPSGVVQRGAPSATQLLGALSYAVAPNLVLDGGMAFGLSHGAPDWSSFAGFTVLLD